MRASPVLLGHFAERAGMLPAAHKGLGPANAMTGGGRRDRIWELSSNFHCSVVGTCLTTAELRGLLAKLNDPQAKTASDHEIHARAVRAAGRADSAGRLLNKMLDKRHDAQVRRFSRAKDGDEVRTLWRECLEKGDVPGAYWAVLTHPLTDAALTREVFGEVHMLSHLVGMSNRVDIARLRTLERELGARDEKIARQEARLRSAAEERALLQREAERRALDLAQALALALALASTPTPDPADTARLRRKQADEQARTAALAERLAGREALLAEAEARNAELARRNGALQHELASLEVALSAAPGAGETGRDEPVTAKPGGAPLSGRRVLYVGGLHRHVDALAALAHRFGATLLFHDGGVEESTALLPGLMSQADLAVFPVDCVSHLAASQVKRLCREAGKSFLPLRTASLASFAAALTSWAQPEAEAAE